MSCNDCIAVENVPHTSRLFREFAEAGTVFSESLRDYYSVAPQSDAWMARPLPARHADFATVAELLHQQNAAWGASDATLANIAQLGDSTAMRAVVTGQQVSLFGGPLYSILKAATAVQMARQATEKSGTPHVPIFWLATEDHDFAEVNAATFVTADRTIQTLHLCDTPRSPVPVGGWTPGECLQDSVREAAAVLGKAANGDWAAELLRDCYAPGRSLAEAFGGLFLRLFAGQGLVVMDASGRGYHRAAAPVLAQAIEQAAGLHDALAARSTQLEAAGYHAQVLVAEQSSLLFLLDEKTGARNALRLNGSGEFAAAGRKYSQQELLQILADAPERISPNALLRPVMQDYLLPTAAYIGGPAELAYFAQSQVLYAAMLGSTTPILPRLSATLLTPRLRRLLVRHGLSVEQCWTSADDLALRLGARAMPIELKAKLRDAGNTLEAELQAIEDYAAALDEGLGHTAKVAASKMRYQRDRLRRMMARFELDRTELLRDHAQALTAWLHPAGALQERKVSGIQFVAEQGPALVDRLVEEAADRCPGHKVIEL